MKLTHTALLVVLMLPCTSAAAQHGGGEKLVTIAPKEVSQLDFLLGEWSVVAKVPATTLAAKIHGSPKIVGTWKAVRALDGWGVDDELRLTDASGNPLLLSRTTRTFDPAAHEWKLAGLDVYRSRFSLGTGAFTNGQMTFTTRGVDADGTAYVARSRVTEITPSSFKWTQDRSLDDGKTWAEATLTVDAKRTAAAHAKL